MAATVCDDDELDAKLAECRGRRPWVARGAGGGVLRSLEPIGPHRGRIDRHLQRRVGRAGMLADLGVAEALGAQGLHIGGLRRAIIVVDEVGPDAACRPTPVQVGRDLFQEMLIAAVIAQKHDVGEARLPQAAGRADQRALEGRLGYRDRAGKAHMLGGRRDIAFRHIGDHRCDQRVARAPLRSGRTGLLPGHCACRAPGAGRSARCRRRE